MLVGNTVCYNGTTLNATAVTCVLDSTTGLSAATALTVRVTDGAARVAYAMNSLTVDPLWPYITSVAPNGGPSTGGAFVRVNGINPLGGSQPLLIVKPGFYFTSGITMRIGTTVCSSATVQSSTSILCTSPAGTPASGLRVSIQDSQSRSFNYEVPLEGSI